VYVRYNAPGWQSKEKGLMAHRVLVVDDDANTSRLVKLYLQKDGYSVMVAGDGKEALEIARERKPDLIVLDLMLPHVDGLEVCRQLRQESDVPIIMLTARTTDADKLAGLDIGADDYVTKPFSPGELAARVRAVLRRLPGERGPDELHRGDLVLDFRKREGFRNGEPLGLTRAEFRLLGVLALQPGRVFSRDQLI
jgi:two-component system, OmpR family, alkaline phosphatase synthesis response regulator PhoP